MLDIQIKEAVDEMYCQVKEDPTKKIPRVYQEVTAKITENLDYDGRCALLQEWPTFHAVQSRVYKKKNKLVPRDPENMKDFDADLHWSNSSSGENIVKGEIPLENPMRIVMFSSNAMLEIQDHTKALASTAVHSTLVKPSLQKFRSQGLKLTTTRQKTLPSDEIVILSRFMFQPSTEPRRKHSEANGNFRLYFIYLFIICMINLETQGSM